MNKENTTIVDGAGDKDWIAARVGQIKAQIAETTSDYDREMEERLAKVAAWPSFRLARRLKWK